MYFQVTKYTNSRFSVRYIPGKIDVFRHRHFGYIFRLMVDPMSSPCTTHYTMHFQSVYMGEGLCLGHIQAGVSHCDKYTFNKAPYPYTKQRVDIVSGTIGSLHDTFSRRPAHGRGQDPWHLHHVPEVRRYRHPDKAANVRMRDGLYWKYTEHNENNPPRYTSSKVHTPDGTVTLAQQQKCEWGTALPKGTFCCYSAVSSTHRTMSLF